MKVLLVLSARSLALLWAAIWMYFFVAETWETSTRFTAGLPWLALGILFIVLAVLPWRWEGPGSWILIATAITVGIAYTVWAPSYLATDVKALTTVAFSGPPLLSGLLLLTHWRTTMRRHSS